MAITPAALKTAIAAKYGKEVAALEKCVDDAIVSSWNGKDSACHSGTFYPAAVAVLVKEKFEAAGWEVILRDSSYHSVTGHYTWVFTLTPKTYSNISWPPQWPQQPTWDRVQIGPGQYSYGFPVVPSHLTK